MSGLRFDKAFKPEQTSEESLQIKVAQFLDWHGHFWQHTPNEGKRSRIMGARLKRQGLKPGMPDVIIYDLELAVELKVKRNSPSPAQRARLLAFRAIGWRAYWVASFDEFEALYKQIQS